MTIMFNVVDIVDPTSRREPLFFAVPDSGLRESHTLLLSYTIMIKYFLYNGVINIC